MEASLRVSGSAFGTRLWFRGVDLDSAGGEWRSLLVLKPFSLALPILTALAISAQAEPPADLDACIKLSAETAKGANVRSEAEYAKFHFKLMDLNAACGMRDFAGAEKIAADIRASFPPNK